MPLTDEEIAAQQRAVELNRKIRTKVPEAPPQTPQATLGQVLQDPNLTFSYSKDGAGGALLGKPNQAGVTGVAIKTEHPVMTKKAAWVGNMVDSFLQNADGAPPFVAPRAIVYTPQDLANNPQAAQTMLGHMQREDFSQRTPFQKDNIERNMYELEDASKGIVPNNGVLVMEFAKGQQLNRLPTQDKLALLKSEAFAESIGRALAPTMACGLNDHLGLELGGHSFKVNPSNFMYEPDSGTLSVIDYETFFRDHPSGDIDLIKFGVPNTDKKMTDLRNFLETACESQENFDAAIDKMLKPGGKGTPLSGIMDSFTNYGENDFFGPDEQSATWQITEQDKRQFAMNLLSGAIDGLGYVQKNQQALQTAALNARETLKGEQIDHFYSDQELQELDQSLQGYDADSLKAGLPGLRAASNVNYVQKQTQKITQEMDAYRADLTLKEMPLQKRLDEVQEKIDRIKNHPTAGDMLKGAFNTKGHRPIDKLRDEEAALQKELRLIGGLRPGADDSQRDQIADLRARQDFQDNMNTVQSKLKPPTVQVPQQDVDGPKQDVDGPKLDNQAPKEKADDVSLEQEMSFEDVDNVSEELDDVTQSRAQEESIDESISETEKSVEQSTSEKVGQDQGRKFKRGEHSEEHTSVRQTLLSSQRKGKGPGVKEGGPEVQHPHGHHL